MDKLVTIFSASGWKRFVDSLASYRNRGKSLPSSITLALATEDERRSYARLLRLKNPPEGLVLRCDLKRVSKALAEQSIEADWQALLNALVGPVPSELYAKQTNQRAWNDFWPWAEQYVSAQPFTKALEWLKSLRRDGSLLRLSKGDVASATNRLRLACTVLAHLPLADEPLPGAAARLCGDAHALDPNSPLATLVLRSLAMQRDVSMPGRSEKRRQLWEQFGIICDDLSAPVLTLNLGLKGSCWLCSLVHQATSQTQPLHLTNRMIAATDWSAIQSPANVFVCENPTIIALAASKLRHACPPMVCVNGEPRSTSRALLRRLRDGGATLVYHGDFDWPGIAIATRVIEEFDAKPWLFSTADYEDALQSGKTRPLEGNPVKAPWSPTLSSTMQAATQAIDEEAVADKLLKSMVSWLESGTFDT